MKNKYTPLTPMQIAGDSFLIIVALILSVVRMFIGDGSVEDIIFVWLVSILLCINIISVRVNHKLDWLIEQQERQNARL